MVEIYNGSPILARYDKEVDANDDEDPGQNKDPDDVDIKELELDWEITKHEGVTDQDKIQGEFAYSAGPTRVREKSLRSPLRAQAS